MRTFLHVSLEEKRISDISLILFTVHALNSTLFKAQEKCQVLCKEAKTGLTFENFELFRHILSDHSIIPRKTLQSIHIYDVTYENMNLCYTAE